MNPFDVMRQLQTEKPCATQCCGSCSHWNREERIEIKTCLQYERTGLSYYTGHQGGSKCEEYKAA